MLINVECGKNNSINKHRKNRAKLHSFFMNSEFHSFLCFENKKIWLFLIISSTVWKMEISTSQKNMKINCSNGIHNYLRGKTTNNLTIKFIFHWILNQWQWFSQVLNWLQPSKIFQFPISIHNLSPSTREKFCKWKTLKILVFVLSTRFSSSHFSLNLPISTCDSLESSMSFVKSLKYKFSSSIGCLRIMMIKQKLFCRKCNFCYYFFPPS